MVPSAQRVTKTRKDYQWGRRLFHLLGGTLIGVAYLLYFNHIQIIHILGLFASLAYVMDQVRVQYPELSSLFTPINRLFLRAEEELKESAAVPYVMATLLCIITFPKIIALFAIFTLAISDPLASIVGIRFGRHPITHNRTVEGTIAFFISTALIGHYLFYTQTHISLFGVVALPLCIAFLVTLVDFLPHRLDDNITIPLSTAAISWPLCLLFNMVP